MGSIFAWVKHNKSSTVLLLIVGYFLFQTVGRTLFGVNMMGVSAPGISSSEFSGVVNPMMGAPAMPKSAGGMMADVGRSMFPVPESNVPPTDRADRLVIQETTLSMVVKDAAKALKDIQSTAERLGGFLVNSSLSRPEENASGTITVRVPDTKLSETLDAFRGFAVRVVDEQVSGRDVTDQYEDLDARLATLEKTKAKFEDIFNQATQIQDILNVQREIINLQSQIDSVKGQQQYLSQSAKLSKITVYLSTDEFSLPYAPAEPWRPNVVFKLAIRSLVTNLRSLGTAAIWLGIYSVIWGPILGVVLFLRRRNKTK